MMTSHVMRNIISLTAFKYVMLTASSRIRNWVTVSTVYDTSLRMLWLFFSRDVFGIKNYPRKLLCL